MRSELQARIAELEESLAKERSSRTASPDSALILELSAKTTALSTEVSLFTVLCLALDSKMPTFHNVIYCPIPVQRDRLAAELEATRVVLHEALDQVAAERELVATIRLMLYEEHDETVITKKVCDASYNFIRFQ